MKIITDLNQIRADEQTAIAIGKFDGIHRGHQELLHCILAQKEKGMKSVVFTFEPAPEVFFGYSDKKELMEKEEKTAIFEEMGVDILVDFPMNSQTAAIPAENFIRDVLVKELKMSYICAGTDITFGDKGKGNGDLLNLLSDSYGYEAKIISKLMHKGREISSSYIKEEVTKGNMAIVAELMGRNYQMKGIVVEGSRIGRTLGIPTANLIPPTGKILPPYGVYYTKVKVDGRQYPGLSNIGCKPTVSDEHILGVETYLYGFGGNLYGKMLQVEFLEHKRAEQKLTGLDILKETIERDVREGAIFFGLTGKE